MVVFFIIKRGFSINAAADELIHAYLPPAMWRDFTQTNLSGVNGIL